jgi:carbamate kinase
LQPAVAEYRYYKDNKKHFQGVEAVIDKDLASALLAYEIDADDFFILTDVSKVYLNFRETKSNCA